MSRAALLTAALLASGCVPEEGPLMEPGHDCLECHGGGHAPGSTGTLSEEEHGEDDDARAWTVAGTVFQTETSPASDGVEGARVTITDATGWTFTLRSNQAGNFYTAEKVHFPLRVSVNGHDMEDPVDYGGCNGCHKLPPLNDADGRIAIEHGD